MKAIRYHWKALIRNKVSMMILLGLFLLTLIPPYYCSLFSGTETPVADVYRSSTGAFFYAFLLFLFLGFFISRLTVEAGLKEVFCRSELTHYTLSGLAVSLLLSVALTVLILIPNLIAWFLDNRQQNNYLREILVNLILYELFGNIIATLFGLIFGLLKNLYAGLAGILLTAFSAGPFLWTVALNIRGSLLWYPVLLFSFIPKGSHGNINYHGWHFGIYRAFIGIFCISILFLILGFLLHFRRRIRLLFGITAFLFLTLLFSWEHAFSGIECTSGSLTSYYYRLRNDRTSGHPNSDTANHIWEEFSVNRYEMTFSCYDKLRADVTLTLDNRTSERCDFTLYRDYCLSSVTDGDNQALTYEREGDRLTVWLPLSANTIHLSYSGGNGPCYANADGLYLRPGFPYYPIAGVQNPLNKNGSFAPCLHETAQFTVNVRTFGTVYSNLEQDPSGHFFGTSNALVLVSGNLSEKKLGTTRVIYADYDLMKLSSTEADIWWSEAENALNACNTKPSCIIFGNSASEIYTTEIAEVYSDWCFWPNFRTASQMKQFDIWGNSR